MSSWRAQRGISLLELMVSLALGLVVVGAVLVSATGMVVASRQQRAYSAMTDDALLALSLIRRDLLMAAYVHPVALSAGQFAAANAQVLARPVLGCSRGFTQANADVAQGVCNPVGSPAGDAIEISFEATMDSVDRATDDRLTDCQGTRLRDASGTLAAAATPELRVASSHRYFVALPARGAAPELQCASAVSDPQALVPNVEVLQIRYGVASGWQVDQASSRRPVRFVRADEVMNWADVVAVHLCVQMRSEATVLDARETATQAYLDCDGLRQAAGDRHLRRAYSDTVALRNRVAS